MCLTLVHSALHSAAHVLDHLAEEVPEQARQEGPSQVQALVGVVIPVILIPPAQRDLRFHPPPTERQSSCLGTSTTWGPPLNHHHSITNNHRPLNHQFQPLVSHSVSTTHHSTTSTNYHWCQPLSQPSLSQFNHGPDVRG